MGLRAADTKTTRKFESDGDWIVLRTNLTYAQKIKWGEIISNRFAADPGLLNGDPEAKIELRAVGQAAFEYLFGVLCEAWSYSASPTRAEFAGLDEESGEWVADCINEIMVARAERLAGKDKPATDGTTSPSDSPVAEPSASASS